VHNMASLPQITVGGACATATHGSGDRNGNLATAVSALRLVTATGDVVELRRDEDGDDFRAIVVGLGGFGVVTHLTLDIRPAYTVRQDIYENLPVSQLADKFDSIMALGYSVSLFTDWQGDHVNQLWIKRLISEHETVVAEPELYGAQLSAVKRHPIPDKSAEICNDQLGAAGPWHERLPHFRVDGIGQEGTELQTEYFVARQHGPAALQTIHELGEHIAPIIRASEVRTVAADDAWMSSSYGSACVGLHFTWAGDWEAVRPRLPLIEERLRPFSPRPHWGKLFIMSAEEVQSRYPRMNDFRETMKRYDPNGKFRNAFLDEYIFG
jgi:alditol oxidase